MDETEDEIEEVTVAEFATKHRITMTSERAQSNPNMGGGNWEQFASPSHSKHVLRYQGRQLTTYFSMGSGHGGRFPRIDEILDALASESAGVEDEPDFYWWCRSLGYDQIEEYDLAHGTYQGCLRGAKRLKTFLGDELYDELLYHTQRL